MITLATSTTRLGISAHRPANLNQYAKPYGERRHYCGLIDCLGWWHPKVSSGPSPCLVGIGYADEDV
ncbi:hypothetical protein PSQ90_01425 [Devosia rhodophyticola]|uniref:Uncharacterized protein n=1 Tax=Devosia rhodophyticola TaxID=3026423 RepID=A0ABY7YYB6_9HYPH|nr:hypothetical protein [Devosia rhodophyticola]WDR06147.1 hypothetical protein PSQ90_01425 [Devosia rhodophyticola]